MAERVDKLADRYGTVLEEADNETRTCACGLICYSVCFACERANRTETDWEDEF